MPQFEIETAGPSDEQDRPSGLMALTFPDLSRPPVEITWDVPTSELAHQVAALMKQADKVANYVQSLPIREDTDAIVADVFALQQQVGGIYTELKMIRQSQFALTSSIEAILKILPYVKAA